MTSFSIARHNQLHGLLDSGALLPSRLKTAPELTLPAELSNFEPSPHESILVYRGDFRSCEQIGHFARIWTATERGVFRESLCCMPGRSTQFIDRLETFWNLGQVGEIEAACHEIARQIELGPVAFVDWLIDCHTDAADWSPFVSATFDVELASRFAPRDTMAVFECRLDRRRCLVDAHDIGRTGASGEVLVLGWIGMSETKLYSPSS